MHRFALLLLPLLLGLPIVAGAQTGTANTEAFQARMAENAARLNLTDEQRADLEPILRANFEETRALLQKHGLGQGATERPGLRQMRALQKDMKPVRERTDRQVAEILSDEQMAEFRLIQDERREQMRAEIRARR
ncbi:MAG: hypothetical protein AAGE01_06355 [Pseudomonadota bacterium]